MAKDSAPGTASNDQINLFPWLAHHPALAEAFRLHCESNSALLQKVTKTIDLQLENYIGDKEEETGERSFIDTGSRQNDRKHHENMSTLKGTSDGRQNMRETPKEHQSPGAVWRCDGSNARTTSLKRLKELTTGNLYTQTRTKLDNARLMSSPYASISGIQVFNNPANANSLDGDLPHQYIEGDHQRPPSRLKFGRHTQSHGVKIRVSAENAIVTSERPQSHGLVESRPASFSLEEVGESKRSFNSKSSLVWKNLPLYIRAQIKPPKGIPASGAHGSDEVHHQTPNASLEVKHSYSDGRSKATQSRVTKIREQRICNLLENSLNLHRMSMGAGTSAEDVDNTARDLLDEEITEADKSYVLPGSFAELNYHIRASTSSEELFGNFHDEILLSKSQGDEQSEETEMLNHDSDEDLRLYSR